MLTAVFKERVDWGISSGMILRYHRKYWRRDLIISQTVGIPIFTQLSDENTILGCTETPINIHRLIGAVIEIPQNVTDIKIIAQPVNI